MVLAPSLLGLYRVQTEPNGRLTSKLNFGPVRLILEAPIMILILGMDGSCLQLMNVSIDMFLTLKWAHLSAA